MNEIVSSWGRVSERIRLHARGESSLGYIAIVSPALATFPLIVFVAFALLIEGFDIPFGAMGKYLTESIALLLCVLSSMWWCLGTYRASMARLSRNAFFTPALLFVASALTGWQIVMEVTPYVCDFVVNQRPVNSFARAPRQGNEVKEKPWSVLAMAELNRIIATGEISFGSAEVLRKALIEHPELKLLEVDSRGGYVTEMEQLVALVREHHLDTLVINRCASACTDVFLAGERRYIGPNARFGFHQSGFKGRTKDTEWSIQEYMTSIYYRERRVEKSFVEKALNTSYYDLWRPDPLDVKRSGFATAWWSDRGDEYR